ncbi:MAG: hypothetical protein HY548_04390, partial [Elusimicrobia bacterium]|nr:hypothetical protein [Elusimicrobiota bacterium]
MRRWAALSVLTFLALTSHAGPDPVPLEDERAAFAVSWRFYEWRIEQGDDLQELETILLRIKKKYASPVNDLTLVERELA